MFAVVSQHDQTQGNAGKGLSLAAHRIHSLLRDIHHLNSALAVSKIPGYMFEQTQASKSK
ncbi:hypothetical protein BCON_0092g00350 [Botryotinia convoluta]|uniref:Uncharacterized protein n=1 Tax=Botryotinia convoluta TaxID=54673 RepID=A0A4Z1I1S7_9HELO|nr:hypothetical protein BCON_0092g00350 [Botryotinia convoluta]